MEVAEAMVLLSVKGGETYKAPVLTIKYRGELEEN